MTTHNDTSEDGTMLQLTDDQVVQLMPTVLKWLMADKPQAKTRTLAVPRSLEIENVQFHLRPTGELIIEQSDGRGIVTLKPSDAFAVLTFLRVPGVAEVIEQAEAADEAEGYRAFLADEAAEHAASR